MTPNQYRRMLRHARRDLTVIQSRLLECFARDDQECREFERSEDTVHKDVAAMCRSLSKAVEQGRLALAGATPERIETAQKSPESL